MFVTFVVISTLAFMYLSHAWSKTGIDIVYKLFWIVMSGWGIVMIVSSTHLFDVIP
jgi:hypothetical protein